MSARRRTKVASIRSAHVVRFQRALERLPNLPADLRRQLVDHTQCTVDLFALLERTLEDLAREIEARRAAR